MFQFNDLMAYGSVLILMSWLTGWTAFYENKRKDSGAAFLILTAIVFGAVGIGLFFTGFLFDPVSRK
jgi:uncharacterized membrane protein